MALQAPPPSTPTPTPNQQVPKSEVYDLDDHAAFTECNAKVKQPTTSNFAVAFDSAKAQCAVDITQETALDWIRSRSGGGDNNNKNGEQNRTLWLNFWASESQRPIIEAVAKYYELSPRLAGLLCPAASSTPAPTQQQQQAQGGIASPPDSRTSASTATSGGPKKLSPRTKLTDVEKGIPATATPLPSSDREEEEDGDDEGLGGLNFSHVIKSLWHFCSVDFGRHYIYVGFNGLYPLPKGKSKNAASSTEDEAAVVEEERSPFEIENNNRPSGQRIWSSLLICDDGTVVSVFERPPGNDAARLDKTRRNVLNVFRHLSQQTHQGDGSSRDALLKVRVRWHENFGGKLAPAADYDHDRKEEAASLLFYYLFDDWISTFRLIARLEHPYREKLEHLRQKMFDAAEVTLVKQVHDVGRQLTVLKLMYQSYELIVSRLIHSQRGARDLRVSALSPARRDTTEDLALRGSRDLTASHLTQHDEFFSDDDTGSNVKLSSSAVVRFERLLDRIRLYALTEIEECLKEKESLVLMVRNVLPSLPSLERNSFHVRVDILTRGACRISIS